MYGLQNDDNHIGASGGFNTDRVTYSRHFQDDEKSESTKDTFNKNELKEKKELSP